MKPTDTKTQILDVAQDLIQRLGANGMSYKDISEAVGIRKASVHTHFPKKDDLLMALLERYSDRFRRVVDSILATDESPETKLRRYCGLYEANLSSSSQDKACLCGMVGAELATLNQPLAEQVCAFYQDNEARLTMMLLEGQQTGDFRFAGEPEALAAVVFASLQGGLLIARAYGGAQKFQSEIEQLMRLVKN
ncbi:MAG: TetR/AcrR family transcriptional regulator [Leptolyngbyaceae cyanobacterium RM1_1_2]|nr:TetR/AcrR family transcriptional regulator [Leptolyngbyaceae cyanobacterium RM1_1_2]